MMGTGKIKYNFQCTICGAAAKGFKYGAISCEACRVFFRRLVKERDDWLRNNNGGEYDKIICTCRKYPSFQYQYRSSNETVAFENQPKMHFVVCLV